MNAAVDRSRIDELLPYARRQAELGNVDAAIAGCDEAHAMSPERLEPIALALEILDKTDTGDRLIHWADRGLGFAPFQVRFLAAKAWGLELRGEYDLAVAYWRRARSLHPAPDAFALQLGRSLAHAGDLAAAAGVLETALAAGPTDPDKARLEVALGEAKLKGADITGFGMFQARDRSDGAAFALPQVPDWRDEDLAGRTLLITHHLGYGDQIMLAPLAAELAGRGGRLVMTADADVADLLAASLQQVRVVRMERPTHPAFPATPALLALVDEARPDFHASLLGACAQLNVDEIAHGSAATTLTAPAAVRDRARLSLQNLRRRHPGQRVIGLAFDCIQHREPRLYPYARAYAARRSVPTATIARLTEALAETCHFVALFPQSHRAKIGAMPPNTSVLDGDLTDFSQTAAVIQALDGVVSVDCGVANLACKLGGPTWVLLAWSADWRWGLSGPTTPWLPTAMLFRQPAPGDWAAAVDAAATAIARG